jgi:hypothetical protein
MDKPIDNFKVKNILYNFKENIHKSLSLMDDSVPLLKELLNMFGYNYSIKFKGVETNFIMNVTTPFYKICLFDEKECEEVWRFFKENGFLLRFDNDNLSFEIGINTINFDNLQKVDKSIDIEMAKTAFVNMYNNISEYYSHHGGIYNTCPLVENRLKEVLDYLCKDYFEVKSCRLIVSDDYITIEGDVCIDNEDDKYRVNSFMKYHTHNFCKVNIVEKWLDD